MSNTNGYTYNEKTNQLTIDSDCKYIMLVLTDNINNNNKFYEIKIDGGVAKARYGRIGNKETNIVLGSENMLPKKAMEKFKKGYIPAEIISNQVSLDKQSTNETIQDIANRDLISKSNHKDKLKELIQKLVKYNQHQISLLSGGSVIMDDNGLVKTEFGILPLSSIQKGRKLLQEIEKQILKISTKESVEKYYKTNLSTDLVYDSNLLPTSYNTNISNFFKTIPQRLPAAKGWGDYIFTTRNYMFSKQYEFLDQLEQSITDYDEKIKKAKDNQKNAQKVEHPRVFGYEVELVTDSNIIDEVKSFFNQTINKQHQSSSLKLKNVYELKNEEKDNEFEQVKTIKGNVHRYWHGTRKFNILSILRNGLVIPKSNDKHVTGRMFGDGVYFSDQSTKSLNYSSGYWDSSSRGVDNNCFMFIADVVMGKQFNAHYHSTKTSQLLQKKSRVYPVDEFNSVFACGDRKNLIHSGSLNPLRNNEMIVYNLNQISLKYLCEFE